MIYRHPDGSFHRFPHREHGPDEAEVLTPIDGQPGWFIDKSGNRVYRDPSQPLDQAPPATHVPVIHPKHRQI